MSDSFLGPVVSSAHLASGSFAEISELEYGLILSTHAFQRWTVRAISMAGYPELSSLDVLVLHSVFHRDRPKKLADICLVLNVEDTHTVNYSIKKLIKAGLVKDGRQGKEKTVAVTEKGAETCVRYRDIREGLLLRAVAELGLEPEQVSRAATLLRLMSGQYDQAARAATTY
ncbi:winged helix DNA-binding protein [uncultured Roseobacter sp.]|uniref:winged helix DNA-binding protein n=1 Tax=uncultured Roseobacter sp. TaxID=114847 RepID=UPI002624AFB9|nr:winged helix DNA-binding protein [uncultured Roseobacter sp.]